MTTPETTDPDHGPTARQQRINDLVDQLLDQLLSDNPPSLDSVVAAHADLMPELLQALIEANRVRDAIENGNAARRDPLEPCDNGSGQSPSAFAEQVDSQDLRESIAEPQFAPGTLIAQRYRIQGLIGVGGMGLVYCASDLKLGELVALKFLPNKWNSNSAALAYLRNEVRTAHRVSHPNVCRVHDIGDAHGQHFLSMEFIDGENLRQLMGRMGPLPFEQSLHIARQICAGLAAAHEQNIIHRDLKPANVMVDGRGNVRVTDFGLAQADANAGRGSSERIAGTREYMAPERLGGEPANVSSDIYSLGLILYELFTTPGAGHSGQRPSVGTGPYRSMSEALYEIENQQVANCIRACLSIAPDQRPPTVPAALAMLPGSDIPMSTDRSADTPTAEIVAAAHVTARLSRTTVITMLMATLLWLVAGFPLSQGIRLVEQAQLQRSPSELSARANEICTELGYPVQIPAHVAYGFRYARGEFVNDPAHAAEDVVYWWRRGPDPFVPLRFEIGDDFTSSRISFANPPHDKSGMIRMKLSPDGQLRYFEVERDRTWPISTDKVPDHKLFELAGLESANFDAPQIDASTAQDTSSGTYRWHVKSTKLTAMQVTATYRSGGLVLFSVETEADAQRLSEEKPGHTFYARLFDKSILLILLSVSATLLYKNAMAGRCDFGGANRLAAILFCSYMLTWLLRADHSSVPADETSLWRRGIIDAFIATCMMWVQFIAVEPLLRRAWPRLVTSWKRAVSGRWQDELVARDVLIGLTTACVSVAVLGGGHDWLRRWMDWPDRYDIPPGTLVVLSGWRHAAGAFPACVSEGLEFSLTTLLLPVYASHFLQRTKLAIAIGYVVITAFLTVFFGNGAEWWAPYMSIWVAVFLGITFRFGLLASVVMNATLHLLFNLPCTTRWHVWFAPYSIASAAAIGILAIITATHLVKLGNRQ